MGARARAARHRYYEAVKKALEGDAKRKYFEHAGTLLAADGSDDALGFVALPESQRPPMNEGFLDSDSDDADEHQPLGSQDCF